MAGNATGAACALQAARHGSSRPTQGQASSSWRHTFLQGPGPGAPLASRMSSPCLALCGLRGEPTGEATRGAAIICRFSILGAAAWVPICAWRARRGAGRGRAGAQWGGDGGSRRPAVACPRHAGGARGAPSSVRRSSGSGQGARQHRPTRGRRCRGASAAARGAAAGSATAPDRCAGRHQRGASAPHLSAPLGLCARASVPPSPSSRLVPHPMRQLNRLWDAAGGLGRPRHGRGGMRGERKSAAAGGGAQHGACPGGWHAWPSESWVKRWEQGEQLLRGQAQPRRAVTRPRRAGRAAPPPPPMGPTQPLHHVVRPPPATPGPPRPLGACGERRLSSYEQRRADQERAQAARLGGRLLGHPAEEPVAQRPVAAGQAAGPHRHPRPAHPARHPQEGRQRGTRGTHRPAGHPARGGQRGGWGLGRRNRRDCLPAPSRPLPLAIPACTGGGGAAREPYGLARAAPAAGQPLPPPACPGRPPSHPAAPRPAPRAPSVLQLLQQVLGYCGARELGALEATCSYFIKSGLTDRIAKHFLKEIPRAKGLKPDIK